MPVVVGQHQRGEQEEELAAGVEDGGDRAEGERDLPAAEGQRVDADHEHHDDQPDHVEGDDVRRERQARRCGGRGAAATGAAASAAAGTRLAARRGGRAPRARCLTG